MRIDVRIWIGSFALLGLALAVPASRADDDEKAADAGTAADEKKAAEEEKPVDPTVTDDGVSGEVVPGIQYYADTDNRDSAKFLEYRDVPNGFVLPHLLFSWRPSDRGYFDLDARDISQKDQRIFAEYGRVDLWKGTIRWVENPRRWTDQAFQLYANRGNGVFTLDNALQSAVEAAPASADTAPADGHWDAGTKGALIRSAIFQSAQEVEVGHQRKRGGVGLELTPTRNWTFSIDADRDRRKGTAPQTLAMYFSLAPAEVAAPYDLTTDWATGRAEFANRRFNVGVQVTASTFETGYKSLTWDDQLFLNDVAVNPNTANPGRMRMLLGTDNDSLRIGASGGLNLPGRTRIDASVARTVTTQDDAFQPMTINTQLSPAALPAGSLDGEHKTTVMQVRATSRPLPFLRWGAWFRYFDLENDSRSLRFADYVQTDFQFPLCGNVNECGAITNRIARRNLAYGFKKTNLGASVGATPAKWFTGTLSFEREKNTREFSAVEDSHEDIWKLALDVDILSTVSVRATLKRQDRKADRYNVHYFEESFPIGEAAIAPLNEGSRRFPWTDRDRDNYAVMADWTPLATLSFYGEASYANDHYTDPETGRKIGDSFTVHEDRNFDGANETYNILLAGRTKDRSTSYSLGATFSPSPRFNLFVDYTWDEWKYGMESRYRNVAAGIGTDDPLDNWGTDTKDGYDTASLGFEIGLTAKDAWRVHGDASRSKGTGEIGTHFVPGGAASGDTTLTTFPKLETTLTVATLALTHRVSSSLDYTIGYWYESWKEDNFASDFNQPYMGDPGNDRGSDRSILLGLDFKNYTNHLVSFLMRYRF